MVGEPASPLKGSRQIFDFNNCHTLQKDSVTARHASAKIRIAGDRPTPQSSLSEVLFAC
jgi:hypothetical protein